ncbi:hypothetical protein OROHE_011393 [Orobanche hederae]
MAGKEEEKKLEECSVSRHSIYKENIDGFLQQGDIFKQAQTNFSTDPQTTISVQTLLAPEQDRSNLLVRGKLSCRTENFIYPCCDKCHRLTTAEYSLSPSAIPVTKLGPPSQVYDDSSEIKVTAFRNEGEKIMQMPANHFLGLMFVVLHFYLCRAKCEMTRVVVDVGDGATHVVLVADGYVIGSSIKSIPIAGKHVTRFIQQLMKEMLRLSIVMVLCAGLVMYFKES